MCCVQCCFMKFLQGGRGARLRLRFQEIRVVINIRLDIFSRRDPDLGIPSLHIGGGPVIHSIGHRMAAIFSSPPPVPLPKFISPVCCTPGGLERQAHTGGGRWVKGMHSPSLPSSGNMYVVGADLSTGDFPAARGYTHCPH